MNLHEYQAKELLRRYRVPTPAGVAAHRPEEAKPAAGGAGSAPWVVKAQAHTGGRGKAGGVRVVNDLDALQAEATRLLGSRLVTHQTGPAGLPVSALLVEAATPVIRELYLSLLVDRTRRRVVCMVSPSGGMDIEAVAAETPERLLTLAIDPVTGPLPWQARRLGFFLGLTVAQIRDFQGILEGLYRLFTGCDASLVEINPLGVTANGALVALDAKINLDDNGLFRQGELAAWRDESQEDARETEARIHDLSYIPLDGDIGCMVNGAGLAMATMDLIQIHGGQPANFLDVGGGTTAARVAAAFKLILSDAKVRAVLVNIFGGIVRCDLIAEGIVQAVREVGIQVPVVVRLVGTNAEQGLAILAGSGLAIATAVDLTEAAQQVVAAAKPKQGA